MTHGKNDLRAEHVAVVRAACIKANPDRAEVWDFNTGAPVEIGSTGSNPCRLADVLLSIKDVGKPLTWSDPELKDSAELVLELWRLSTDNLTAQSDECLAFLASLLK